MRSSTRVFALSTAVLVAGCFDFDRRLDPCGFDPESEECLDSVDGGAGSDNSGGSSSNTGGTDVGGGVTVGGSPAGGAANSGGSNSGGAASGGSNSGGSGGSNPVNVRLVVNEIFRWGSHWVEVYNAGTESAQMDDVTVYAGTSGPAFDKGCALGTGTLSPGGFAVVQHDGGACQIQIASGATVYLYADGESFHERKVGNETTSPAAGQSWYALVDGGDDFTVGAPSKGISNQ